MKAYGRWWAPSALRSLIRTCLRLMPRSGLFLLQPESASGFSEEQALHKESGAARRGERDEAWVNLVLQSLTLMRWCFMQPGANVWGNAQPLTSRPASSNKP